VCERGPYYLHVVFCFFITSAGHQGLSFFTQNMSYLGPAGQVHAMITDTWLDYGLNIDWASSVGVQLPGYSKTLPKRVVDGMKSLNAGRQLQSLNPITVSAQTDQAGTVAVRITNSNGTPVACGVTIAGMTTNPSVTVYTLTSSSTSNTNTVANPLFIAPTKGSIQLPGGTGNVTVPGYSYTILVFTSQ
jgi:hypothetical protein